MRSLVIAPRSLYGNYRWTWAGVEPTKRTILVWGLRLHMPSCHLPHCDRQSVGKHPVHGLHLCERCERLIERFGHPRTLGDLSSLIALALLKFGPSKVRAALARLETLN